MDENATSRKSAATYNILIVDDERTTLAVVGRQFEQLGYRAHLASNGRDALDVLKREPIDLVLLDVVMPEMDGWVVLESIRRQFDELQLPIIMFTATEDRGEIVKMFEAGANDYVSKPFDCEITVARVETQLRLKRAQNEVRLSEERYALAARATNDGLWDWDLSSDQVYYSPRWCQLIGRSEREYYGSFSFWFEKVHPDDRARLNSTISRVQQGVAPQFDTEMRIRHEDGSFRWIICRGVAVADSKGITYRIAGSITDITGGKVADVLTGLPNRLLFRERVTRCIEEFSEASTKFAAVLYLDLDNFKFINDTFGHKAGDRVLQAAADRLQNVIGTLKLDAVAARFGGDEFAVLVEEVDQIADLIECATHVHSAMFKPITVDTGREVFSQASIGIAVLSSTNRCVDELLSQADIAMYDAKSHGKSRTSFFDQSMRSRFEARLVMETELRKAIHKKSFQLEFQPIYDILRNEIVGFEALMRWIHPELGPISPYDFILLAEELNLIQQLGEWMVDEVCAQIAAWKILLPLNVFVSVNISSKQFAQSDFVERLLQSVEDAGIECENIKLEITESVIMKNLDQASNMIRRLQGYGFRVAIDDFGTGFSSLAYLHQLPLDILKIDKSFVQRVEEPASGAPIVNTILTLASNLNLAVIAEGVETQEQLKELKLLGCRYAQGFLFSMPMTSIEATNLLLRCGSNVGSQNGICVSNVASHRPFRRNVHSLVSAIFNNRGMRRRKHLPSAIE